MVEIRYFQNKNRYAISFKGHSTYKPHGEDIVCASVTSAALELGNYVLDHADEEKWKILEVKLDEGDSNIEILDDSSSSIAIHLYQMTMEHLQNIAESYPLHVKILKNI